MRVNISKNQRLAITVAFFAGGYALYFFTGLSFPAYAVTIAYCLVGSWLLARFFGSYVEETFSFPYSKERVSETIPRVMNDYHAWRKKILCSDSESGHFSFQVGLWAASVLIIDVNRLDDKSCAVKVRCEMKFFSWSSRNLMVRGFFYGLNARLAEATAIEGGKLPETGYLPLEYLSKHEQTVGTLLILAGFIIAFAGMGSLSAPQYGLNIGVTPIDSIVLVLFGVTVVLIALVWFVVKTRAWKLFSTQPQNEAH